MLAQMIQVAKGTTDVAAYGTVLATLTGWLPPLAALFSILWLGMQMLEKITGVPFHQLVRCVWRRIFG